MKKNSSTSNGKGFLGIHNKAGIAAIIATAVIVFLCVAFFVFLRIYYHSRWYPNTWIGDRDVSGMKIEESSDLMNYVYGNFQLNINGRDNGSLTITQNQIGYTVDIKDSVQKAFDEQHKSFRPFSFRKKKEVTLALNAAFHKDALKEILQNSVLHRGSGTYRIVKPQDARVVFSEEKQYLVVKKEVTGNTLNMDNFYSAVEEALLTGHEKLDLTDGEKHPDVYKKPSLTAGTPELTEKAKACNAVCLRWLEWNIDKNVTETVEPKRIYSWCSYSSGKVTFRKNSIRNWVEKLCLKYKTVGMTRTFKNHAGKEIKVAGGDYGWAFNYESMVKQVMNVLERKMDSDLQAAYMENPGKEQRKALTITKKPKYDSTAFQFDYDNKENDWDKKNFTEISLQAQKVYVWRKGKVVFSCRCITGRPVPERQTRTGAYFIKEHQPHRVLKGDDYETPVDNWVRIMWTGTGFHAAPWQPWSVWSKTLYKSRGSHGCINLSYEDSVKIYKLTKYREMVFIY